MELCNFEVYIEGSATPGTQGTIYDPANILNGAKYQPCGKIAFAKHEFGSMCEDHAKEYESTMSQISKCRPAPAKEPILGARPMGQLFQIHPLDLGAYLTRSGVNEMMDIIKIKDESPQGGVVKLDGNYYILSVDYPAVTKDLV